MAEDLSALNRNVANPIYSGRPTLAREIDDLIRLFRSAGVREDVFGKLQLHIMPTPDQRLMLSTRAKSLLLALKEHNRKKIAAILMDMLASYDVAQARAITADERRVAVAVYVKELAGVPTWAVEEACSKIRLGAAPEISPQFKPTPIQVRLLAVSIAQPFAN